MHLPQPPQHFHQLLTRKICLIEFRFLWPTLEFILHNIQKKGVFVFCFCFLYNSNAHIEHCLETWWSMSWATWASFTKLGRFCGSFESIWVDPVESRQAWLSFWTCTCCSVYSPAPPGKMAKDHSNHEVWHKYGDFQPRDLLHAAVWEFQLEPLMLLLL